MKLNLGSTDRKIRTFLVAPLLMVVGVLVGPTVWYSWVLYALALVMVATSAASFCPLYALFGIGTRRTEASGRPVVGAGSR